ncbi:Mitochondrial import inner membrane translocase subunit Tim21 [Blattella germanica]|nr:Mitochondrial import inner membrane translocase subunit Tim21 [Blattella germanica]
MSKIISAVTRNRPFSSNIVIHFKSNIDIFCCSGRKSTNIYKTYALNKFYCTKKDSSLTKVKDTQVGKPVYKQVKENAKTASYMGIILAGVGVTAVIFYQIFKELFSSKSPNSVYTVSLQKCCEDPRVIDALGEPIKGYGEETRRGRRRHVSHLFYEKEGISYLRMKYYIQGSRKKGTVHLEMWENEKKDFDYRYLFVQLDDFPRNTIIIEDNRLDKQLFFEKSEEKPFNIA